MAERRMFSKTIIDSDVFLDLPLSTQALYFHLAMRADDDGFINNPKKIMRMVGASQNELELLLAKRYILAFDSGVVVIKHWKIHNYIQKDRYTQTKYLEEREQVTMKKNGSYTEGKWGDEVEQKKIAHEPKIVNNSARIKRQQAKAESELPYSFEYKIRAAFVGARCPICDVTMGHENTRTSPTIQHNKPISLGGKHELDNISVICRSCNSSISNHKETPAHNSDMVALVWEKIRETQDCPGNVSGLDTQVSIGKESIVKSKEKFTPPTPEEVEAYGKESGHTIDSQRFCDFYASKGWLVGKVKMKDWKAAVRNWHAREPGPVKQEPEVFARHAKDVKHLLRWGTCLECGAVKVKTLSGYCGPCYDKNYEAGKND